MTIQYSVALRNMQLNRIYANMTGGPNGSLVVFSGAAPASAGTTETGTRLIVFDVDQFAHWNSASGGVLSLVPPNTAPAIATGTAGYWRLLEDIGQTTALVQGSVAASGAELTLSNLSIVSGQVFSITSFVITHNQS